ncbi:MAG: calcium-binding protein [Actinomycetota bacterium]
MGKKATKVGTAGDDSIKGTKKADVIVSKGGDDVITGKKGNDTICSGDGNDTVYGQGGADKINGGGGADVVYGMGGKDDIRSGKDATGIDQDFLNGGPADDVLTGDGNELLWQFFSGGPVNVDMATGRLTGEGTDSFSGFNSVYGSQFDDTIVGDDQTNFIFGDAGHDTIDGGANLDLLTLGAGNDNADGGDEAGPGFDLDIVYFNDATEGVTVNLDNGTATTQREGQPETDTLANFESVVGSDHDDTITGDNQSNILFGGRGNDTLEGGGGPQIDYASYWFAAGAVNANLATGTATGASVTDSEGAEIGEGTDTLGGIEGLLGTISFNDTLVGDESDNYLDGDLGDDNIDGAGGDDLIVSSGGDDAINGGAGDLDMVDYFGTSSLTIDLGQGTLTSTGIDTGSDTLSGIEAGSGDAGNDTFIGNELANRFFGWGGNDNFAGNGGDDQFDGGLGTNTADGGAGNDTCVNSVAPLLCEVLEGEVEPHPLNSQTELVNNLRRNF